jgi:alkylhydroperoxidase/carboxymuconolactone decarboxylase family protein YurZ
VKNGTSEGGINAMGFLQKWYPEFTEKLDEIDALREEKGILDEKTYQFLCLALAIRGRSAPCVKKHFLGALEAGATMEEVSHVVALTMREAAGNDDCWIHDVIGDERELMKQASSDCCCS